MTPHRADKTIAVEERRLRAVFLPALLVAAGFPLAVACGTFSDDGAPTASSLSQNGGAVDEDAASKETEAGAVTDAGVIDITDGACAPSPYTPSGPDAGTDRCIEFKELACGLPPEFEAVTEDCYLPIAQCAQICHRLFRPCHAVPESCADGGLVRDRPIIIECAICPGSAGRRPEGFAPTSGEPMTGAVVGDFFAEITRLEAASIDAFDRLRDELTHHGAPRELISAAEGARKDEIAHARAIGRIARRHGGRLRRVARSPRNLRALADVARENMVEGCVRETFGALIAAWQATHTSDPTIADALAIVAEDELRHAALSWAVARWSDPLLTDGQRREIARARDEAVAQLFEESDQTLHTELIEVAGLPGSEEQRRMLKSLTESLWAA